MQHYDQRGHDRRQYDTYPNRSGWVIIGIWTALVVICAFWGIGR